MQVQSQKWQNDLWSNCALWIYCFCCSVAKLCPTLCNPVDCSSPGLPVPHYLPVISQVHIHWISDAIQLSQPLSTSSLSAFKLYQHLFLFFQVTHLKRPLCWEKLKVGEGDDRGWCVWMASLAQWMSLSDLWELVMDRKAWHAAV